MTETFSILDDWQESRFVPTLTPLFEFKGISKLRGHAKRPDLLFLSDEPGFFTIFYRDAATGEESRVIQEDVQFSDSSSVGDFALHPEKPWAIHTLDFQGDRNHSIFLQDLASGEKRMLAEKIGNVNFLFTYSTDWIIVVVVTAEDNRILKINLTDGSSKVLYKSAHQILSAAVSEEYHYVIAAVGRKSSTLEIIDIRTADIVHSISEAEGSRDTWPAVNDDAGMFAYISDLEGDHDVLIIRRLDTFELVQQTAAPGFVGFFILDVNYTAWVDENTIAVSVVKDGQCNLRIYRLDTGEWTPPIDQDSVSFLTRTSDGLVYTASGFSFPGEIRKYKDKKYEVFKKAFKKDDRFKGESIQYTSADGRTIQGWLAINKENPDADLIVLCHGGPTFAVLNRWGDFLDQALILTGYHVFQPNFRGSMTFGPEFMNLNIGDVGGEDLQDVIYGTKYVAEMLNLSRPPILMGASYGAYLTLMGLTAEPGLWAGGVSIFPITDWGAFYDLADAHYREFAIHFLGGPPAEKAELIKSRSPITHIESLADPVLIMGGTKDQATPFPPIEKFYKTGKELSKPVYLMTEQSGHGAGTEDLYAKIIVNTLAFCEYLTSNEEK